MIEKIIRHWEKIIAEMKEEKEKGEYIQSEWEKLFLEEGSLFKSLKPYLEETEKDKAFIKVFEKLFDTYWDMKPLTDLSGEDGNEWGF